MATSSMTVLDAINECYSFPYSKLYMELMKESYEEQLNRHYVEAMKYRKEIETLAQYDESYNIDTSDLVEYNEAAIQRFYEDGDEDDVEAPPAKTKNPGLLARAGAAIKKFFGWIWKNILAFGKFLGGKIIAAYRKIVGNPDAYAEKVKKHTFTKEDVEKLLNTSKGVNDKLDAEFWRHPPMQYPSGKCPARIKFGSGVKGSDKVAVVKLIQFMFSWTQENAECVILVHNNAWKALLPDAAKNADDNFVSNFDDIYTIVETYTKLEEKDTKDAEKLLKTLKSAVSKSKGTPIKQRGFRFSHANKDKYDALEDQFNQLKSDIDGATGDWRKADGTKIKEITELLSNIAGNLISMLTTFKTVAEASRRAGSTLDDILGTEQVTKNNTETEEE